MSRGEVQAEFQHWRKAVAQRYPVDKEMVEVETSCEGKELVVLVGLVGLVGSIAARSRTHGKHRNGGTWHCCLKRKNHVMLPFFFCFLLWVCMEKNNMFLANVAVTLEMHVLFSRGVEVWHPICVLHGTSLHGNSKCGGTKGERHDVRPSRDATPVALVGIFGVLKYLYPPK